MYYVTCWIVLLPISKKQTPGFEYSEQGSIYEGCLKRYITNKLRFESCF